MNIPNEAVEAAARDDASADEAIEASPSSPRYVPIKRNEATLSWNAKCTDCGELLFMLTDEAVHNGPRRDTGGSPLLPVTMSIHHECFGVGRNAV